ncbi:hypothetical protein Patl1_36376 [Pistacia atlantica]|nr:hypothetical protein Patl1_36376 [Pistacia atlantica]
MNDPSTSPPLLPREEADLIPFSSQELPQILDYFSFSHDSTQAKAIEDAVKSQETETKIFSVPLGAEDGDRVEGVAACHMDTSHWSPDHISFRMLGIKPGSSHVCHLFATDNLVFVPKSYPLDQDYSITLYVADTGVLGLLAKTVFPKRSSRNVFSNRVVLLLSENIAAY